jgi:hypothetical protein
LGGDQTDGGIYGINPAPHDRGTLRVQIRQRLSQTGTDPDHQHFTDLAQRPGVGLPYVTVALCSRQRRQCIHEVHHVRIQRSLVGKRGKQLIKRPGKVCE